MQPMGPQDFALAFSAWKLGPRGNDLHTDCRYPQHQGALRSAQAKQVASWAKIQSAAAILHRATLQERADAAGVSIEVMAMTEQQQSTQGATVHGTKPRNSLSD